MRNFFYKYSPLMFMFGLVVLGVFIGGFLRGGIFYSRPKLPTPDQINLWTEKVGKIVTLPEDEVPKIAAVSNPEFLKDKAYFSEAKVGDIALFYSNKFVLYDPVADRVIVAVPTNSVANKADLEPKFQGEQLKTTDPNTENQF